MFILSLFICIISIAYGASHDVLHQHQHQRKIHPLMVKVENYSIAVEQVGKFMLYQRYNRKLVLHKYPAFFFNEKEFQFGTPIQNMNDEHLGCVIGHYDNYYPIAPRLDKEMHCGHYNIDRLLCDRTLWHRHIRYEDTDQLKFELSLPDDSFDVICYIDM